MKDATELNVLASAWELAKADEKEAVEKRRILEDQMAALIGLNPEFDGTASIDADDYVIKVVGRLNHKVNSEVLDDIIRENGAEELAHEFFRFKPELNLRAWKQANDETQAMFFEAITTSASRPSFSITVKE